MTSDSWKRIPLWIIILILSCYILVTHADYAYMVKENALMKHEFIADVVGYN